MIVSAFIASVTFSAPADAEVTKLRLKIIAAYQEADASTGHHRPGISAFLSPHWKGVSDRWTPITRDMQVSNEKSLIASYPKLKSSTIVEKLRVEKGGVAVTRRTTITAQHVDASDKVHVIVSWTENSDWWQVQSKRPLITRTRLISFGGSVDGVPNAGRGKAVFEGSLHNL